MTRRTSRAILVAVLAATPLALAGCAGHDGRSPSGTPTMSAGMVMGRAATGGAGTAGRAGGHRPSTTASMICGDEIRAAVRRNLGLTRAPEGRSTWSRELFACTYRLPGGSLRLSVEDLDRAGPGRAYFDGLRRQLGGTTIEGVESFGLPSFETARGDVVYLKDDKTLWVDAAHVPGRDLPEGESREDVAYGVAAAVIGCWTE